MSWGEGSMSWAELRDLVTALPEDSATKAAVAGDSEGARWTQSTYIGASTYNALLLIVKILWTAHLKGEPPDMDSIQPPPLESDEQADQLSEAIEARNRAVLERLRPQTQPGDAAARQADVDHWLNKIRELQAAQPQ
jgi:hypothetical protein